MTGLTYLKTLSGLEVVIIPSGAAYCTQSSYSRWLSISRKTVVDRCRNLEIVAVTDFDEPAGFPAGLVKTTINAGSTGNKEVVLIPAKIMFRWLAKDNPELFDEIGDAGATQLLYTLAGYQIKAIAPHDRPCWIEDSANPWVAFFDRKFCDRVFSWYGAQFYWEFVYKALTPEEAAKVNRLNPPIAGVRTQRIHQYLTPEAKTRLTPYIGVLVGMVYGARCREHFRLGYADKFGGNDQLRIPGIDR